MCSRFQRANKYDLMNILQKLPNNINNEYLWGTLSYLP
jgi:hypothetical protein